MGICSLFQEMHRLLINVSHNTNWIVPHMTIYYTDYTVMASVKKASNIKSPKSNKSNRH